MPPTPRERWARVEGILDGALDQPVASRAAWLAAACAGEDELRGEVERLLAAHDADDGPLARGGEHAAAAWAASLVAATLDEPTRVGPWRVLGRAGEGGMGTVYRAERDDGAFSMRVAVKVMRRALAARPELLRRFADERQVLARLRHPNIARLLDGGVTDDGLPYYVMEYVDGEPIDRWCEARALPLDARLALFAQVCDAVADAHAARVVHRDIKPSNVLVTAAGEPKLLDFGIAKLLGEAPNGTRGATRTGNRLLTPAYASPEQLLGEPVTPASDVWALGAVLYELLTGRRPFRRAGWGSDESGGAAPNDAEAPPPPSEVVRRSGAPDGVARARALRGAVDAVVLTALRREPERRYATAAALAADVRRHLAGHPVTARADSLAYRARTWARRRRVAVLAALVGAVVGVAAIGVAAVALGRLRGRGAAPPLVAGPTRRVAFEAALELDPALSPDGTRLAYASDAGGATRIHVRPAAGGPARVVSGGVAGHHRAPRWSPDGRTLLFEAGGATLYAVPVDGGGPPRAVVTAPPGVLWVASPAWSPDGRRLAYVQDLAILVRDVRGGEPRRIPIPGAGPVPHSLAWSPDGRWLAYVDDNMAFVYGRTGWGNTRQVGNVAPSAVWAVPVDGGAAVRLTDGRALDTSPVWLPSGRGLLFVSNREGSRDVYQLALDGAMRPDGPPRRLTAGLDAHTIDLARDGRRLAYSAFRKASNVWALALPARAADGAASSASARQLTGASQMVEALDVSPDGRWLAFDSDQLGNQDLYLLPVAGGEPRRLVASPGDDFVGAWSPDGRTIAYHSILGGGARRVRLVGADGRPAGELGGEPHVQRAPSWAPDGRSLVFSGPVGGRTELHVASRTDRAGWGRPRQLTTAGGMMPRWSPTGSEVAYVWTDGVRVIPAAGGASRLVAPADTAAHETIEAVRWAPDGRTLYYKQFDVDGRASVWTVPAVGGARRLVARLDAPGRQSTRAEFATDGRTLYFTVSEHAGDIWIMEVGAGRR